MENTENQHQHMDAIEKSLRLALLIRKHLDQTLTSEEAVEMESLRREAPDHDSWFDNLSEPDELVMGLNEIDSVNVDRGWERLQAAMKEHEQPSTTRTIPNRWKLAAVLTGVMMISGILLWQLAGNGKSAPSPTPAEQLTELIKPGQDKAYLILADGSEILLDSAGNGSLVIQGNMQVMKQGDVLSYKKADQQASPVYNTIRTPKGGQFKIELSDGSRVLLNAASSLRFPTTFSGDQRIVELSGEAYFEVRSDAAHPFTVSIGSLKVDATGTRFNINAYPDEAGILTTLAEGSVRVRSNNSDVSLKPEQEVFTEPNGTMSPVRSADLETRLAWTNGKFIFNAADVPSIMRQICRWYDVEVSYSGPVKGETFTGMVSRQSDISRVLRIMEAGGIKFRIEKNKIMVE
jgi:transmembrane sensor